MTKEVNLLYVNSWADELCFNNLWSTDNGEFCLVDKLIFSYHALNYKSYYKSYTKIRMWLSDGEQPGGRAFIERGQLIKMG